VLAVPPAHAAFPGANGKIAFERDVGGNHDIYVMNENGLGVTPLTTDPANDEDPAWSPDGTKIAFVSNRDGYPACLSNPNSPCLPEIYVMNADGSNQTRLTHTQNVEEVEPAWTPDGTKITYTDPADFCGPGDPCLPAIHAIYADGSGAAPSPAICGSQPAWSPDGARLAYVANCGTQGGIFTVKPDGTDDRSFGGGSEPDWAPYGNTIVFLGDAGISRRNLDASGFIILDRNGADPAWSPDRDKIAFSRGSSISSDIWVMNAADGTGQVNLTSNPSGTYDRDPSWQAVPSHGFARPKGATPAYVPLTVAYKPCVSWNRAHGPPFSLLSCNPPVQASDYLTVGTLDANQQRANSSGFAQYDAKPGNLSTPADEADVKLTLSILDVRKKDLSDYPGELSIETTRRISDKDNSPPAPFSGDTSATAQDFPFSAGVPCATTSDTTIGSLCSLSTTADTLVPGSVKEGMRSIWQLSRVLVYDGGADGDADTASDNTLFMDQGIFVP
jgi:Tol biopolymer transport system component